METAIKDNIVELNPLKKEYLECEHGQIKVINSEPKQLEKYDRLKAKGLGTIDAFKVYLLGSKETDLKYKVDLFNGTWHRYRMQTNALEKCEYSKGTKDFSDTLRESAWIEEAISASERQDSLQMSSAVKEYINNVAKNVPKHDGAVELLEQLKDIKDIVFSSKTVFDLKTKQHSMIKRLEPLKRIAEESKKSAYELWKGLKKLEDELWDNTQILIRTSKQKIDWKHYSSKPKEIIEEYEKALSRLKSNAEYYEKSDIDILLEEANTVRMQIKVYEKDYFDVITKFNSECYLAEMDEIKEIISHERMLAGKMKEKWIELTEILYLIKVYKNYDWFFNDELELIRETI